MILLKEARVNQPSHPGLKPVSPLISATQESAKLLLQVLLGTGLWLGFLLCWAPLTLADLQAGKAIPVFWQSLYLLGLYLWLGACLGLSLRRSGRNWQAWGLGQGWPRYLLRAFGCGIWVFACLWFWGYSSGQLLPFTGPHANPSPFLAGEWAQGLLVSLFAAWALAGIEELLFRGWLWGTWLPALGPRYTLLLQALVFSAVHGESWQSGWVALHLWLIGLLLGGLRQVTGQLGAGLGLHAGWICAVLSLNQWGLLTTPQGTYNPLHTGSTLLIWLGPLIWLCFQWRRSESQSAKNAAGSASVA